MHSYITHKSWVPSLMLKPHSYTLASTVPIFFKLLDALSSQQHGNTCHEQVPYIQRTESD